MKKIFKTLVISVVSSAGIYLCLAYGLLFFSEVEQPSGEMKNLNFEQVKTDEKALPELKEYEARDGTPLTYRHYESSADQILILLHGSGYHSRYLEPLANYLANENVSSVYTPNFRGHGANPERRGTIDYIGQIEHDIQDFIQLVNKRHPDQSIVLGGHSSGGGTVIRTAGGGSPHDVVDKYLLLAPYIHHNAPTNNSSESGWANVSVPRMIGLSMLNQAGIGHMNDTDVISFNMPDEYRDGTETLTYDYRLQVSMHPGNEYEKDIASMNDEVLVVAGREDESFHAEKYEKVFNVQEQAEIILLNDLSHFGPIHNEQSHEEIAAWLTSP
ncbi:alpha/beta hydrolase [Alkalicoccus halolimnae]|uniref:Alpha/beta fold hydrolase n=1 Tax=Alkalicoccus halolimnae TaxID=1667239 RepID=A0A5C7F3R5_9BACI|nr:alpha/beta hydrolase [Alkalicoccus halolimnae]TXF85272.1 alpha/beta fold hydrolase [Alkalicoccus halolimnae]